MLVLQLLLLVLQFTALLIQLLRLLKLQRSLTKLHFSEIIRNPAFMSGFFFDMI